MCTTPQHRVLMRIQHSSIKIGPRVHTVHSASLSWAQCKLSSNYMLDLHLWLKISALSTCGRCGKICIPSQNKKHLKNVGPIRHCKLPHADVHNNNNNAWQRGPLWPHRMGPIIPAWTACEVIDALSLNSVPTTLKPAASFISTDYNIWLL